MAQIRPFAGLRYARRLEADFQNLIAPPFDVLDAQAKSALQARHPNNIVTIDLPHIPPKAAGPAEVYARANMTLRAWMDSGVLVRDQRPAFYAYKQSFQLGERTFHRRGFFALVKLSPFGAGHVVPHEKTYQGAIEDRLALMRATQVQMSPIFGLYSDPRNQIANRLFHGLGKPDLTGTLDEVRQDLWLIRDAETENEVMDLMRAKPIYIADGHHRYTTALAYQKEAEAAAGGKLPPNHPACYCMFALVSMHDDGLLVLPTHRMISGLAWFDIEAFKAAIEPHFAVIEMNVAPDRVAHFANETLYSEAPHTFGLYVGRTKKAYLLRLKNHDILKPLEPERSDAWRRLDVAILQRYLIEEILQPSFAEGKEVTKGYTADAATIVPQVDGEKYQIAIMLQNTPLQALEELGKHNEVMPQKSTYFYPKLATGMVMNPLW